MDLQDLYSEKYTGSSVDHKFKRKSESKTKLGIRCTSLDKKMIKV